MPFKEKSVRNCFIAICLAVLCCAMASVAAEAPFTMSDAKFKRWLDEYPEFALADDLLAISWKATASLPKARRAALLNEQRQWLRQGRNDDARAHAASMSEDAAYAVATRQRADAVAAAVSRQPAPGTWKTDAGHFSLTRKADGLHVQGENAPSPNFGCQFSGRIEHPTAGWNTVVEKEMPDFYILFTDNNAYIAYSSEDRPALCGSRGFFEGEYRKVK